MDHSDDLEDAHRPEFVLPDEEELSPEEDEQDEVDEEDID